MIKVNFKQNQLFEYQFKRNPKSWTIEQLHDLWMKAKSRANERNLRFWNYLAECYEKLPKSDNKIQNSQKSIYYYHNDKLRQFDISYRDDFKSYSFSVNESKLKDRDSKLEFWIANDENT